MIPPGEIAEVALGAAGECDGAVAIVTASAERNVRFAGNQITTSGDLRHTTLSAIAIRDEAVGSARAGVASVDEAAALMRSAIEMASRSRKAADAYTLADGAGSPGFESDLEPADPAGFFETTGTRLDTVFSGAERDGLLTFGYVSEEERGLWLATTTGTRRAHLESRAYSGLTLKPDDYSRSVWSGDTAPVGEDAGLVSVFERCRHLLGLPAERHQVDPGQYDVVLSPSCVADMLIWMYWVSSLRDADEGKTVFSDRAAGGNRLGEQIYPAQVHLWSDPAAPGVPAIDFLATPRSHSLASVFDNGAPIGRIDWIEGGVQRNLVSTRQWAAKSGTDPAPMSDNLILDGDAGTEADLIAGVERGLYVNCLWYIRLVDPQTALLTGLTRDGVWLIEDGKIAGESNNFRFNQSPVEMLAGVTAMGESALATPREFDDTGGWVMAPPIVTSGFNMSTVSEAT